MTSFQKITCPNCHIEISLDEVIGHQLQESIRQQVAQGQKVQQAEFAEKQKQIVAQLESDLRAKIGSEKELEMKVLADELAEKKKNLSEARETELALRKERNKLEDEKQAFALEKQKQLDAERTKIRNEAQEKAEEEMRLKILEKEKQLQDAMKANMELTRKLQQGSQQTQGEVLELELEELLRTSFPRDSIEPVPKGINGADVIQKVVSPSGIECGVIAWESKHTKAWNEQWVAKLKDDQRTINADLAVLVTEVLPKDIKSFGYRDGVWVTGQDAIGGLGTALRAQLVQASTIRRASVGKNEKMEVLYTYLSGTEFRHKVEAIVEAFVGMKQDLDKEKRAMIKIWSKREKQIEQVVINTTRMYGDMQGLLGSSIQPIAALEAGDEEEEDSTDDDE